MLRAVLLAAGTLAAQETKSPVAPQPKRVPLEEAEALRLENLQLRYEQLIAAICARAGIAVPACAVDARSGVVFERPQAAPAPTKPEVKK